MAKGKSINLTPRDKPKKKQDKYSETSDIKKEYKFNLKDTVIYLGLLEEYKGNECIIIKRSRRNINEYYRVKFEDKVETDTPMGFLKTLEEYELWLSDQEKENDDDNQEGMSDVEKQILEKGLTPFKNRLSCYLQVALFEHRCHECGYEDRCIYIKKYKYDKVKFN